MAPARRDNPHPLFASNTPQALAHLPVHNAFGDRRWVRPVVDDRTERTPLLVRRGTVYVAPQCPSAAASPEPEVDEVSEGSERSVRSEATDEEDE